ncbi:unnamed protein product [Allacma fusca]|uniref:DUF4817 domain-containing protein n=1 Tax=Allacma fusca TaxID=39272 RepID=A0A8J2NT95_9HEXA|nr:unnamed protein product [Allacma fusca]
MQGCDASEVAQSSRIGHDFCINISIAFSESIAPSGQDCGKFAGQDQYDLHHRIFIYQSYIRNRHQKCVVALVRRAYRSRYHSNTVPCRKTVLNIVSKLEKDGTLLNRKRPQGEKKIRFWENLQTVTRLLVHDPEKSTRRLAYETGIAKTTVQRLIKDSGLRVTRPTRVQQLKPEDYPKRIQFSNEMIARFQADNNLVDNIMWTDESSFDLSVTISTRNAICYGYSNPKRYIEKQIKPKNLVCVWCGIWSGGIIGLYFFESTVDGKAYLKLLQEFARPSVEQYDLMGTIYRQQDGAPAHWAKVVREFLKS